MKKFLFYYCLCAIFLLTGCKDSSEGIDDPAYGFSVTPASINVDAQGGKQSISISTTSDWDINCDASWVRLESRAGSGNKTFTIDIEANKSTEKRSTTLTVKEYKKGGTNTVTITQEGMNYSLSVDPVSLSFANTETKDKTVNVKSNDDWTVECSDSWIKTDKKEGSGNGSFNVSITGENSDTSARQGTITVKGKNGKESVNIKVVQSAAGFYIDVNPGSWTVSSSDAANKVFNVDSNDKWSVTSDKEWLTILKGSESGSGNGNFTAEVTENQSKESRTGHITLKGENSKSISIEVTQPAKGYNLVVKPEEISDVDANGGEKAVDVSSNDEWTVKVENSATSWLSTSKNKGSGNESFTIKIEANTSSSERTSSISVTGSKSGITKTIKVTQKGKIYELKVSPNEIKADSNGKTETITVVSNDDWTVKRSASWIKLNNSEKETIEGSGDGTFSVTITKRSSANDHNGTITVIGKNSGKECIINVLQTGTGYKLKVQPTSISAPSEGKTQTVYVTSNDTWSVSSSETWISLSNKSGSNDGSFTVTISENISNDHRSGTIYVTGANSGTETIAVSQDGKVISEYVDLYVDLGLSVKWATCNLGATYPEESGSSFGWYNAVGNDYSYYSDVAYERKGNGWRVPTYDEIKELIINCSWEKATIGNVKGIRGTSNKNGQTIFFPMCDQPEMTSGSYWTSSVFDINGNLIFDYNNFEKVGLLYFTNDGASRLKEVVGEAIKYDNRKIRPVYTY